MSTSNKDMALHYARDLGWAIHPVNRAKLPTTEHGRDDATRDEATIGRYFGNGAQIGVATGPESGIFVLDVDVKPDKNIDGRPRLAELEALHGLLPRTPIQRTGSGGLQHIFNYAEGVRNSQSSPRLGAGLDIRGAGGYIVVAPSHNTMGAYEWLVSPDECPVADAPAWLIDLARKPERPAPMVVSSFTPRDVAPYVDRAFKDEIANVATAPDGQKHEILRNSAVKLATLISHGLDERDIESALFNAISGRVDDPRNAAKTIQDGIAYGKMYPRAIPERTQSIATIRQPTYEDMAYIEPARSARPAEVVQVPRLPKLMHGDQMERMLPPAEWLIPDMIPKGKLIENYGMGGSGKSTLNLDLALTVAQFANVVYVAGEDEGEYVARKSAWHEQHKLGAPGFYFWPEPINLLVADELNAFLDEVLPLKPMLVIIDPLANCMAGYNDSDTKDMNAAVAGLNSIRKATGATVLVCHHTGWSDTHERGSSVLRWACRLVMKTQNNDGLVALSCEKVNGAKKFDTRYFRMVEIGGSIVPTPANKMSNQGMPLTANHISILDALGMRIFEDGATFTQLAEHTQIGKSTMNGTISRLMGLGAVEVKGEKRRGAEYILTEVGRGILNRHNQGLNPYFAQPQVDEVRGLNWIVQLSSAPTTELQLESTELGANYDPNYDQPPELDRTTDLDSWDSDDSSSNVVQASQSLVRPLFGASSVLVHASGSSSFAPPSLEGGDTEQPNEQTREDVPATSNYASLDWSFVMRMYAMGELAAIERHCTINRASYEDVLSELRNPSKDED